MTISNPTSNRPVEALTTHPSKKGKIILTILMIAITLSVAVEIGYATSLAKGYSSMSDSHIQTICTGKVLALSQKGIIRDVGGFSGSIYQCIHTRFANSIYGNAISNS